MDTGYVFFEILNKFISFLKISTFVFLGYELSLWVVLLGGILIFLIFYFIFKIGE